MRCSASSPETLRQSHIDAQCSKSETMSVSVRAAAAEILLPKSGSAADFTQRSTLTVRCRQL